MEENGSAQSGAGGNPVFGILCELSYNHPMSAKPTKIRKSLNCDFTHHAYCLLGEPEATLASLKNDLQELLNFTTLANPDFYLHQYNELKVGSVRDDILKHTFTRPFGTLKVVTIVADSINDDSQNVLLKFFEEPIPQTKVFLILPSGRKILPTISSRLITLRLDSGVAESEHDFLSAKDFLDGNIAYRISQSEEINKSLKDEKITRKEVRDFVQAVFREYLDRAKGGKLKSVPGMAEMLAKISSYTEDESPSWKGILEYLAVSLPLK